MRKKDLNVLKVLTVAITGALVVGSGVGFTKNQFETVHAENKLGNENCEVSDVREDFSDELWVDCEKLTAVYEKYKDVPQVYGEEKEALDKKSR